MIRNVAPSSAPKKPLKKKQLAVLAIVCLGTMAGLSACTTTSSDAAATGTASAASSGTCASSTATPSDPSVAAAQAIVNKSSLPVTTWDGPTTGPKTQAGKNIVFIVSAESNTGDTGVYAGFKEAATAIGWNVTEIDGQNSTSGNLAALNQAIALKPDAIAVSSFDPNAMEPAFAAAKAAGIPVVGNHTGNTPGFNSTYPDLAANVTSDPTTIAQVTADCALVASNGTAQVTITGCGSEAIICSTKEAAMKKEIETSPNAKVLKVNEFPFESINSQEAGVATADYQQYGSPLGYMLAINDNYWDAAIPALQAVGAQPSGPPLMIAAGDGSPAAFDRIRQGQFQIATVAEPLNEHGWQMADEINRALNNSAPSGFVTYPRLVTKENVDLEGGAQGTFDPDNGYRDQYKKIWGIN
ncbi:substrate-binding domain-containing protein [Subtercola lobariae]|uniref:Sugar ABC transporter substrate-binding protein n=1 Tax=Subtercola lobariae TaxID=1588641 RepID=A0A917B0Y8_9MICO|nr:substrate-binding domain-containing protein [Subtercola lobariae]GGF10507.1 sugar ABC transporter substrate-binding protein [Subtercola lobariae]